MLIRKQIIINKWLDNHLKKQAKKYRVSQSEMIRAILCLAFNRHMQSDLKFYSRKTLKEYLNNLYFHTRKHIENE